MRLFVAAELPDDLRTRIMEIQGLLRRQVPAVRWARPEGIHLTFKFLGEVDAARRESIEAGLRPAVEGRAPFLLRAAGLGVFPERGAPRIIWIGLSGDLAAAGRLREGIETAMEERGFAREGRPFAPHLTIGRCREGEVPGPRGLGVPPTAACDAGGFSVTECVLFRSHLEPGGARYEALARIPLRGVAAA